MLFDVCQLNCTFYLFRAKGVGRSRPPAPHFRVAVTKVALHPAFRPAGCVFHLLAPVVAYPGPG